MRCEDALELLGDVADRRPEERRAAVDHVASCADCQSARAAVATLRAVRDELIPLPADETVERAIDAAMRAAPTARYRRGFWSGAAVGAALAAALTVVAVGLWPQVPASGPIAVPEVRVAVNEPRSVTVMLESPEPLQGAEVHIVLTGAIGLDGYEGQRELRWATNLERGANELTLPVVALSPSGGQLLVEVAHGDKRRTFVVDVRAVAPG